jgi:hypothetical protein
MTLIKIKSMIRIIMHLKTLIRISNVNDIETKAETFRYRSLLSDQKQNILIWSAHDWIKSGTFWCGPNFFLIGRRSFRFWSENFGTNQSNLISFRKCLKQIGTLILFQTLTDQSKTLGFCSKIFVIESKSFPFWRKFFRMKQNNVMWSENCRWQSRTFLIIQIL